MKLESFQIINCFGFIDSGKINLNDPNNFIYILGRNSSGKSSFLNTLKYFGYKVIPENQKNFRNYNVNASKEPPRFIAEFSISKPFFFKEPFTNGVYSLIKPIDNDFNQSHLRSSEIVRSFVNDVVKVYEEFSEKILERKWAKIERDKNGNYSFFIENEGKETYDTRISNLKKLFDKYFTVDNQKSVLLLNQSYRRISLNIEEIEGLLFIRFPQIITFTDRYSLIEELPERITVDTLDEVLNDKNTNSLLKIFIKYLGEENIGQFLKSNDPEERDSLLGKLRQKIKKLTNKVNLHDESEGDNKNLLEIILHEKNGLQITVKTDGKPCFYSNLSDNTKFLFAYYLYKDGLELENRVVLFDEPNNGFHATAQVFLLNFLKSLANSNLVIVSTHSEHIIDLDYLSGVRLMSSDKYNNLFVENHFYLPPKDSDKYLALQPIFDAIGLKYGSRIDANKKVIITEGITDLLYLRAFKNILHPNANLDIAPSRGDANILGLVPLLISQGIAFKIVIDKGKVKDLIERDYGISDDYILEVPVPSQFASKIRTSGIEDLFTKKDFKETLSKFSQTVGDSFEHIANSTYMGSKGNLKRIVAHNFYSNWKDFDKKRFDNETLENFDKVLRFCFEDKWFTL
jgi:energy-coupling factor transporter ATP-binding protein EcfA2